MFSGRMCLGSLDNIRHLGVKPQKPPQKLAGRGIPQPYQGNSKIAINWSPMEIFASNFANRFITGSTIEKKSKLAQRRP